MPYEDEDILQAVKALLPVLDQVVPEEDLRAEVDGLIAAVERKEKPTRVLVERLRGYAPVREWLSLALYEEERAKGLGLLPGQVRPQPGRTRYVCPEENCSFEWYVRVVGRPVPPCPVHCKPLVPAEEKP